MIDSTGDTDSTIHLCYIRLLSFALPRNIIISPGTLLSGGFAELECVIDFIVAELDVAMIGYKKTGNFVDIQCGGKKNMKRQNNEKHIAFRKKKYTYVCYAGRGTGLGD